MYNPQPIREKDKGPAWVWYNDHRVHVDRMLTGYDGPVFPPCGSDCIRPVLWKPGHWKWLLEMTSVPSRTLVRIIEVNDLDCKVVLPGFDGAREHISLLRDQIPPDIWNLFEPDKRCHAKVNLGAEQSKDLVFSDWEPE